MDSIELTAEEKRFIKEHPKIIVGGEMDWPPYDYVEDGEYIGAANDYLSLLEKHTGLKFEVKTGYSWSELLQLIRKREIDVLPMLWYSDERTTYLNFTKPYLNVRHYLFVSTADKFTRGLHHLNGKTIAIPKGYVQIDYLRSHHPDIDILEVRDSLSAIDAVITGKAQALIENTALVAHHSRELQIKGVRPVSVFDVGTTALHMGARKDWPLLRVILQKGLDAISSKEKKAIANRWTKFESSAEDTGLLSFDQNEWQYLEQKGRINACVDPNWLPLEKLEDGQYIGMGADYLDLFRSRIGIPIDVIPTDTWAESVAFAKARKCDMFVLSMDTPERRTFMDITTPYLKLPLVIATRPEERFIADFDDLSHKKVGIVEGYALVEIVRKHNPNIDLVFVPSSSEGLKKVIDGELFGFLDTLTTLGHVVQADHYGKLKIGGNFSVDWELGIATRNDEPLLGQIFERVVISIPQEKIRQVMNRWMTIKYERAFDYDLLWKVVLIFSVMLAFFIYRNRQLMKHRREQERIQAALEEREHLYHSLLETTDTGYLILDNEGHVIDANQEYVRLTGHASLAEIRGRSVIEWTASYDLERNAQEVMNCMDRGYVRDLQVDYQHPNETIVPIEVNAKVVQTEDGLRILSLCRDITERKHVERELANYRDHLEDEVESRTRQLRESERRYRLLAENMADVVWSLDISTMTFDYTSPSVEALRGYTAEEVTSQPLEEVMAPESLARIKNRLSGRIDAFFRGDEKAITESCEYEQLCKDGSTIWTEVVSTLVQNEDQGLKLVGVTRDLTARRQFEAALRQAKEVAEAATRSKSEFLANMSHEIRTPMNAITGFTHLALQTDLDDKQRTYIEKANTSAEGLLGILNDILDFSKIESGKVEIEETDFMLKDVIDNIINLMKLKAGEKDVQLESLIDEEIPQFLNGDPMRLSQVLINLCGNAIKFSDAGGTVLLRADLKETGEQEVVIHFSVQDNGIGISKEQQNKLFRAFSQADSTTTRKYGGTGLGLVISKKIVSLMGGDIWVESEAGVGSTFHFTVILGRLQGEHATPARPAAPGMDDIADAKAKLQGARILLVEDNEINLELAVELLTGHGIEVDVAFDGREALYLLQNTEYDGVLMDCQMPVMDGYTATRQLRKQQRFKRLPVIAMTANAMVGDKQKALESGMNDHIAKPINAENLFVTMARWIEPGIQNVTTREKEVPPDVRDTSRNLPNMPGIDIQAGLKTTNNNQKLYRRVLLKFRDDYRDFENSFRAAQKEEDPLAASREAHSMKGVAANLGMTALQEAAFGLETACNEKPETIDNALKVVLDELHNIMDGLHALSE